MENSIKVLLCTVLACQPAPAKDKQDFDEADIHHTLSGDGFFPANAESPGHIQIGGRYDFQIPTNFHLTQYSSSRSYNQAIITYHLQRGQDTDYVLPIPPEILREDGCTLYTDKIVTLKAGIRTLKYCHTAFDERGFRTLFGNRFAFNHIEVANSATKGRLLVQVFDQRQRFNEVSSRMHTLCENEEVDSFDIEIMNGYWHGERVRGTLFVCTTTLDGIHDPSEQWKIAGFLDAEADCCDPRSPRAIEVVYMEKSSPQNDQTWEFARNTQVLLADIMRRSRP